MIYAVYSKGMDGVFRLSAVTKSELMAGAMEAQLAHVPTRRIEILGNDMQNVPNTLTEQEN